MPSELGIVHPPCPVGVVARWAVEDELIRRNPCRIKGAGREASPERSVVSVEEVYGVAGAIERRWRALVLLAAFGGLRWGELAGLRRHRLDLATGTVRVEVAVVEVRGKLAEGPPKWESRRTVTLPGPIVDELRSHVAEFSEPGRIGRVFTRAEGRDVATAELPGGVGGGDEGRGCADASVP